VAVPRGGRRRARFGPRRHAFDRLLAPPAFRRDDFAASLPPQWTFTCPLPECP
jgi:hypothetical protein